MSILSRIRNLLRDGRHTSEIDQELAFHLEMRTEENILRGMPADEARRQAERSFGNRTLASERTRDFDVPRWLDMLAQNLRYSVRALWSSRAAGAVLVASLALGIGANTAMFTLIYALLMRPLAVQDPGSLYSVTLGNFCSWGWVERDRVMNHALFTELRREQDVFSELFAYAPATLDISAGGEVRLIPGAYVSSEMWRVLGLRPVAGRATAPADEKSGSASAVAVIGEAFWESEYGRDYGAIGRPIVIGGRPFTIIGVAPRSFLGMYVGKRADVYVPLEASAWLQAPENPITNGQHWWLTAVGRLRPGVTEEAAGQRLAAMSPLAMRRTIPADWPQQENGRYLRQRFEAAPAGTGFSDVRNTLTRPLLVASGLLGMLLLLACANIATLQLSRGLGRRREYAVRIALGASRARLGCQVFLESLLAALAGAALGVALSYPATRMLTALYSTALGSLQLELRPDSSVLAFTAIVAALAAVLFGIAPVVQAMRTNAHDALKSVRATGSVQPVRQWLLAVETGLAVVLAAGAMLFGATLRNLTSQNAGFRTENVLLLQMDTQRAKVEEKKRASVYRTVVERMEAIPGVESVGASYVTPLSGGAWQANLTVESDGAARAAHAHFHVVTPDFFKTYSTPLLEGRALDRRDAIGAPQAVLVNRAFVKSALGGGSFLARRVRCAFLKLDGEIVGVVADAKYRDLRSPVPPTVYASMAQNAAPPEAVAVALRTRGPLAGVLPAVRRAMSEVNPEIAYKLRTFDSQAADSVVNERALAAVSGLFGVVALLLAGVGVYGLAAYSVMQRRAEIGIRMALGAPAARVLRLLFGQTGKAVAAGVLAGGLCAAWAALFTDALLFGVTPRSPWIYASAGAALFVVAGIAIIGPSMRAIRLDPAQTLRVD